MTQQTPTPLIELTNEELEAYITNIVNNRVSEVLSKTPKYLTATIPGSAVRQRELIITGEQVQGGIIENFSSTGIDDRASNCVMTLMDDVTVVENNLLTKDLTVKGSFIVEGEVAEDSTFYTQLTTSITKNVQKSLREDLFKGFAKSISDSIKADGIDLTKLTINGDAVIESNRLGHNISESNLQHLGLLRELQVAGETVLADTLYVTKKRVGINTLEPSAALSVWDQEVEVTISKTKQGHAQIGTPRAQAVTLTSNGKQNIVLNTDGSTSIPALQIGTVTFGATNTPPSYTSTKGHIMFNSNPTLGSPLGWVCLGNSNWANFGIID